VTPIEVDFSFQTPNSTNVIDFIVYVPHFKIAGTGEYLTYIAEGRNCTSLNLQSCPAVSGGNYTLKSQLFVDPLNGQKTVREKQKILIALFFVLKKRYEFPKKNQVIFLELFSD